MRLLATADLHGRLPEIEPCDVLVLAGDICPDFPSVRGDKGAAHQAIWLDGPFRRWLTPIAERGTTILSIWGNHDFVGQTELAPADLPWLLINDESIDVGGVRFHGFPWVPGLPRWAFHATEEELQDRVAALSPSIEVLVANGPPYGYGDALKGSYDLSGLPERVGDKPLAAALDEGRLNPKILLCGHIHEGRGFYRHQSGTGIYNVSHLDERYGRPRAPVEIILATNAAEVPLATW